MLNFKTKIIIVKRKQIRKYLILAVFFIVGIISVRPTVKSVFSQEMVKMAKKKLPIYSVKRDDNKISISFDAAWGADDTEELLRILKENEVKTTFFICGYWIDKYPEKVKKIYEEGHEIGNHSNTHPHGSRLSLEQNKEEIKKVHNKVKDLLGIDMILYRPPFGEYNDTVLNAAKELGYYTIQWDVDSLETEFQKAKV